jgi:hypothetical protein
MTDVVGGVYIAGSHACVNSFACFSDLEVCLTEDL